VFFRHTLYLLLVLTFSPLSYLCRHKKRIQAAERATLVQGLQLPQPLMTAPGTLTPALPLLSHPPVFTAAEHSYALPADTTGQAVGRRVRGQQHRVPPTPPAADPDAAPVEQPVVHEEQQPVPGMSSTPVPHTTDWRRRKMEEAAVISGPSPPKKPRKQYTCRKCGTTGHTQYYGQRYTLNASVAYSATTPMSHSTIHCILSAIWSAIRAVES